MRAGRCSGLPALDLGAGVRLRGRIDRVDVGDGGEAVVYDYKSRVVRPADRWIGEGHLQVALYMRAVEDLLGLRAVGGFYQPLAGSDLRARGVLDADSGVDIECVRGDAREHAERARAAGRSGSGRTRGRGSGGARRARGPAADV